MIIGIQGKQTGELLYQFKVFVPKGYPKEAPQVTFIAPRIKMDCVDDKGALRVCVLPSFLRARTRVHACASACWGRSLVPLPGGLSGLRFWLPPRWHEFSAADAVLRVRASRGPALRRAGRVDISKLQPKFEWNAKKNIADVLMAIREVRRDGPMRARSRAHSRAAFAQNMDSDKVNRESAALANTRY
jgi:ubiquitin-protein ligase